MKKLVNLALAIGIAAACSTASAGMVTFESFVPGIYTNGDMNVNGKQIITTVGQGGFDGAIINGSDPFSCDIAVCPSGNSSNYYAGLNDGGMSLTNLGGATQLRGLDFGFILPVDAVLNFAVGRLVIIANDGTMISREFDLQGADGKYGFAHWNIDGLFSHTGSKEFTFIACLYTSGGECVNPANNQAQFAIDNIAYVPEPATMSLFGISILGMLAAARRRKSV